MLEKMGDSVDVMIYMDVPEQELVQRILLRGKDSGRADDASEEIIRNRIEIYNQQTAVVAEYYRAQGKYIAVPSLGTIDEVFERIATEIEKLA
jgi:adenylate kinase